MKFPIKFPDDYHSNVTWEKWITQKDVNAPNLDWPKNLADKILDYLHTIYLQLLWLFQT